MFAVTLSLLLSSLGAAEPDSSPVLTSEFIYEKAPFPQCHASTLTEAEDGTLVAAWFGGTREKHPDVGIWVSRRVEGSWTTPVEAANGVQSEGERHPCWNPVLTTLPEGKILLFFKVGPSPSTWWGEVLTSHDGGRSWGERRRLADSGIGPVKNKPLLLNDGLLLCGSSTEHDGWRVHFEQSADGGRTWSRTEPINDGRAIGAIQPSLLQHGAGKLQALGRSRQGKLWTAWSTDSGRTWGEMSLLELPNPNSGTDAVTLADGRHLLVYNHTRTGRSPLNVAVSRDGLAWRGALVLEREAGEFSYPAVFQSRDGRVHITYTWKRQKVKYVALDPAKLAPRDFVDGNWPAE